MGGWARFRRVTLEIFRGQARRSSHSVRISRSNFFLVLADNALLVLMIQFGWGPVQAQGGSKAFNCGTWQTQVPSFSSSMFLLMLTMVYLIV